jgi:hypothetical protein
MRGADRPLQERVSAFDRATTDRDEPPLYIPSVSRWAASVEPGSIRRVFADDETSFHVFIAQTHDDRITVRTQHVHGGGGGSFARSALSQPGGGVQTIRSVQPPGRWMVVAVVADDVNAVRVDGHDARNGENVYVAMSRNQPRVIVMATARGDRVFDLRPPGA